MNQFKFLFIATAVFFSNLSLFSEESNVKAEPAQKQQKAAEPLKEDSITTSHTVVIEGEEIHYKATAGNILLKDEQGNTKASVFYVSYIKDGEEGSQTRPITYCFNGGPGSSAIWLHLGVLGPRRVSLTQEGYALPPYHLVNNEYSILDLTDLVFIDPVSTGYSRPAQGEDAKQFHGVEEDIKWVGEFIRVLTTRANRWDSPKFIVGESYGTTRAAGLAGYLHDDLYMYLNGVILLSSVLNFQTLYDQQGGNDLPYILTLPSFTATAWYHKRLSQEYQNRELKDLLKEVEDFSLNEYVLALTKGDKIPLEKRKEVIKKLAGYTGISEEYLDRANMRMGIAKFIKELLRFDKRAVGRFDSRFVGIEIGDGSESIMDDPSFNAICGAFTATFNQYIRTELKWDRDENYRVLANVWPWDFGKGNQYLNVANTLRDVMLHNPSLSVFVGNGYYDLATPYFASDYTFNHLGFEPEFQSRVVMEYYDAGHMMYIHKPSLIKVREDLKKFIPQTIKREHKKGEEKRLG